MRKNPVKKTILQILNEKGIDITPKELLKNSIDCPFGMDKKTFTKLMKYGINTDTIKILDNNDRKRYFDELREWRSIVTNKYCNAKKIYKNIMSSHINKVKYNSVIISNIIDSRECEYDNCPGTVYIFESTSDYGEPIFKTCGDSARICDKVLIAFVGVGAEKKLIDTL